MKVNKRNEINLSISCDQEHDQEYDQITECDWVYLELATIIYDYRLHTDAAKRIELLFDRVLMTSRRGGSHKDD